MTQRINDDTSGKRKISEMISEVGSSFISMGKTPNEKQNRLTAVCSAWNMACASPENRQQQLQQFADNYRRFNPSTSPDDLAKIVKDMDALIERKLRLFPDDHRQIVEANVVMVGNGFRIEVVSIQSK